MLFNRTFLIHASGQRGRRDLAATETFLRQHLDAPLYTSRICWSEFAEGCRSPDQVQIALSRFTVVEIDESVAWMASRISHDLRASGRHIGDNDIWIAATALTHGLRWSAATEGISAGCRACRCSSIENWHRHALEEGCVWPSVEDSLLLPPVDLATTHAWAAALCALAPCVFAGPPPAPRRENPRQRTRPQFRRLKPTPTSNGVTRFPSSFLA